MIELTSWVFVYVQVDVLARVDDDQDGGVAGVEAVRATVHERVVHDPTDDRLGSPVQTMSVSVQPAGTVSVTIFVSNWPGPKVMGLPA